MMQAMQRKQVKKAQSQNVTGIPQGMKEQFENASGLSFDDVRIHYRSEKPAQFSALAYTKGNQVYLAKGQEKHLGHELGHVVQQKLGLVRPNRLVAGQPVNDDPRLEAAADHIRDLSVQGKPKSSFGEDTIQRISEAEALSLALRMQISEQEYEEVVKPAICVEAGKNGKSFIEYIGALSESDFRDKLRMLHTPFDAEPDMLNDPVLVESGDAKYFCLLSGQYPDFYSINGMPLLVHRQVIKRKENFGDLISFIGWYLGKGIQCYRGINIAHFAWEVLRTQGILASDGSNDMPTFTMGEPTRWLPFDSNLDIPQLIAGSPGRENAGLLEILGEGVEIPIGAVIPFVANINTPVAYLNAGEKVVRGPLKINKVDVVTSNRHILPGIPVGDLPEAAPYKASREQLEGWFQNARIWMGRHAQSK